MKNFALVFIVCSILVGSFAVISGASNLSDSIIVFENRYARYEIGCDGKNLRFIDKSSGVDYCDREAGPYFASIHIGGKNCHASKISRRGDVLTVEFGDSGVTALILAKSDNGYFTFEVLSVKGSQPDSITFADLRLKLYKGLDEPFACCSLALNLQTNSAWIPGANNVLMGVGYKKLGFTGVKVAIAGCPTAEFRDLLKKVVTDADEIPKSDVGGPWALDAEINRGSYVFNFRDLTLETVDQWIEFAKMMGINQIDFHGSESFRWGDFVPNPKMYPNGRADMKAVIDKLHAANITAGLHTYAFFISSKSRYVSPVPDPRLFKDATFTLASDLTADAKSVSVIESTKDMSTVTGFQIRNSVIVQIDDELIRYKGVTKEPPYTFTDCERGFDGTLAAAHSSGAKVRHMKQCFGLYVPDPNSTLLEEMAANHADMYNECGFDMIYLDALDGAWGIYDNDLAWYYASKFVFDIATRLDKPALIEASAFPHHLWYVRSRTGASDHPKRGYKKFVDIHCAENDRAGVMLLPMNLGWWSVVSEDPKHPGQVEPTFSDDIEYLMGKCIGWDSGMALMGVNPGNIDNVPLYKRLAPIFRQYEDLRHADYFSESLKARLRVPGDEFTLFQDDAGKWWFKPMQYEKHKVQGIDGWSNIWTSGNRFGAQPVRLRIEALMSVEPYDSPNGIIMEDFADTKNLSERTSAEGVSADLKSSTEQVKAGTASACFTGKSVRGEPNGSWAKTGRNFESEFDASGHEAFGVWVYGDGQGEVLNLQITGAPRRDGGLQDRYVKVDFTGWRYFELVEPEGDRTYDYIWPHTNAIDILRQVIDFSSLESFSLWYNNLPEGKEVKCYISPVKALPLVKGKVRNPGVKVGGKTIIFPVEMESGSWLEFNSMTDCKLYGSKGELISEVKPEGEQPVLATGENRMEFTCDSLALGIAPRVRVTTISSGEPLLE